MSDTPIELKEIKPIGQFLLDSGRGHQCSQGMFYHYSDVCVLLQKYAHLALAEARAEIERLKTPMITDMREKMAALCHDQWAGWMEYLFLKSKQVDGCVIIPAWAVERWRRQVATRYPDLSEDEKNSDRNEADRFLSIFNAEIERKDKLIEQMRKALRAWTRTSNIPLHEAIKITNAALEAVEGIDNRAE